VGSNSAEAVRIFQGEKILSTPSFRGEVKLSVPCRRFAACNRSLNGMWKSTFRQNYRPTFSPTVPPFAARIPRVIWTWRCLAAEIGTSKPWGSSGLHNKPIGCGASGAFASGLLRNRNRPLLLIRRNRSMLLHSRYHVVLQCRLMSMQVCGTAINPLAYYFL